MKRLMLGLVMAAALWSAACGGGGSVATPPPPVGGFTNANLNGQYAFVTTGEVFALGATTATSLARVGSFSADGNGNITGGMEDVNAFGTANTAISITGGSYTINADGRGTLTLNLTSGGVPSSINFGIVLTSTSDGLMIDETSTSTQASTGSGNFVKQNASAFVLTSVSGPYVFDFSGFFPDANQGPASIVGQFAVNGAGTITTGVEDVNNSGLLTPATKVSGSLAQDALNPSGLTSFGRGLAQINGVQYAFYIVDGTRVRFLNTTGGGMLSGDAVAQTSVPTSLSKGFAFALAGSTASGGGLTRVGRFIANGSSVSNALVDTNNAGAFTFTNSAVNTNITLDSVNPGRGTITFLDPNLALPFNFVFYLSSGTQGVIQETTQNGGSAIAVADGTIAAQSGSPFSSSNITGTYALNWSGLSVQQGGSFAVQDEEDLVGQVTASSLNLTGAADIFQFTGGAPQTNLVVGGSIIINGDGSGGGGIRNAMSVTLTSSSSATVNFVVYFVNPQLAFFANNTNQGTSRIVVGVLKAQQSP
jgi:hypothetical protein